MAVRVNRTLAELTSCSIESQTNQKIFRELTEFQNLCEFSVKGQKCKLSSRPQNNCSIRLKKEKATLCGALLRWQINFLEFSENLGQHD